MKSRIVLLGVIVLSLHAAAAKAQEPQTENTLRLSEGQKPATGTVADMAWLAGHWKGEALGGKTEEIWTAPDHGTMLGMYRLVKDGVPIFYELLTLGEEKGSLVIRLKHFNRDMTGWEEKNEVVEFRLAAKRDGKIYFEGVTFQPEGDTLTIFLASGQRDGTVREEVFRYRRVKPAAAE
ncbi:MAG TPA: DUF6265 family protein [Thermoanaerobaculia bacterium]|nr:DUF6265 family protein [Thermoanaerobaculia bacterium]